MPAAPPRRRPSRRRAVQATETGPGPGLRSTIFKREGNAWGVDPALGRLAMKKTNRRTFIAGVSAAAVLSGNRVAFAQKKYDDGASDTEIKIGHTNPYSGPASSYGVIGKCEQAYWKSVNDRGG